MAKENALEPLLLGGFTILSVQAQRYSGDAENEYRIGIHRTDDSIHLIGLIYVHGDDTAAHVAVSASLTWRDQDFNVAPVKMPSEGLVDIVAASSAVHTLYDAGAMALRHAIASLGTDLRVALLTPKPIVEIVVSDESDEETSDEQHSEVI